MKTQRRPIAGLLLSAAALLAPASAVADACSNRTLQVGFYAYFAPVSYSADRTPGSAGFDVHRGYEADLLTAVEAMEEGGLAFKRHGIATWDNIWLRSSGAAFDLVGGGITIMDSRTRDATGATRVVFTHGHIRFRQSLLVRSADASRLADYGDLTADVRVGVLAGTTGEARLLQIVGLADREGVLAAGTVIETPSGTMTADGSDRYAVRAAGATDALTGRVRLLPPDAGMPQVIVHRDAATDQSLLQALRSGEIDALARGEVGNRDAVAAGGEFVVTALDPVVELGGFTVSADEGQLAECIGARIDWLTDDGRIGYAEWVDNPQVFLDRARTWQP